MKKPIEKITYSINLTMTITWLALKLVGLPVGWGTFVLCAGYDFLLNYDKIKKCFKM